MNASLPAARLLFVAVAALGVAVGLRDADGQILQISSGTLTTYTPTGATPVQDIRPMAIQRGVGIDGSARAAAGPAWAFAGNPFGDAMSPLYKVGDVNLATGAYMTTDIDIALPAPGASRWVIGRTFNGRQETSYPVHRDSNGLQGYNWHQLSQPELVVDSDKLYIIYGADRFIEFQQGETSGYFIAKNGAAGVVQLGKAAYNYYIYTDQAGTQTWFFGSDASPAAYQIWKIVDPAGNIAYVGDPSSMSTAISSGFDGAGRIKVAYDGAGRRYCYDYSLSAIGGAIRLIQVLVEDNGGGEWGSCGENTLVAKVDYDYYSGTTNDKCLAGDLKLVTITTPLTDSGVESKKKKFYWYYTRAWDNSDGRRGEAHQLKLAVGSDGYRGYDWLDSDVTNDTPLSASLSDLKPYSDAFLEYTDTGGSSPYRISSAFFNGECGCGGGGGATGTSTITYADNGGFSGSGGYDVDWLTRAVVHQPDGVYCTYYFDELAQPLSRVVTNSDPSGSPTKTWVTGVERDSAGCVTAIHTPENLDTYTNSTGAITYLSGDGLINVFNRVSGTNTSEFPEAVLFQKGTGGTAYFVSWTAYDDRDFEVTSGVNVIRPVVVARRAYHTAGSSAGTSANYDESTYTYAWWSATNTDVLYITPMQITATNPAVISGHNGSGSSTSSERYLRPDGTAAFTMSPDGVFSYAQYTNGQITEQVRDVSTNGTFPSGEDPQSDFGIADNAAHSDRTTTYAYDLQGRMATTTLPTGRITENYYSRLKDQRLVVISWPRSVPGGSVTRYGPASYTVSNQAGKTEFSAVVGISSGLTTALTSWIDETKSDPMAALLNTVAIKSMRTAVYSECGRHLLEDRAYFSLPAGPGFGAGSEGTEYDAARFGYDDMGRKWRSKTAAGTITRTVYDELGRPIESWIGTNDHSFTRGEAGTPDNMVKTTVMEYDGGNPGGNSHLTTRTLDADGDWLNDGSPGHADDRRITTYLYDYRGRLIVTEGLQAPYSVAGYDNLGRRTASAIYSTTSGLSASTNPTSSSSNRRGLSEMSYDELGRVYKTTRHKIVQSGGSAGNSTDSIDSLTWYDPAGRVMKVMGESAHEKRRYDRLGRLERVFTLAMDDDSQYGHASASTAVFNTTTGQTSVAGDIVLVENQTAYESTDSDNMLMRVTISRHYDDLANGTTGELDLNADGGSPTLLKLTAVDVMGRAKITATWYDDLDRVTDTVRIGTNGIVGDRSSSSSTYDRASHGSPPSRSPTDLRTTTTYDVDGSTLAVTDPKGYVTRYEYDRLLRQTAVFHNYDDGVPGGGSNNDKDQTVRYGYSKGHRVSITADLPSPATDQVTTYFYGAQAAYPTQMKIFSNDLLRAVRYPGSSNTATTAQDIDSDSTQVESYAYNALGQRVYTKDQATNVIEIDYDTAGRETQKRATYVDTGDGFDDYVQRISTDYDGRGMVSDVKQWSDPTVGVGSTRDHCRYSYDEWGNLDTFTQDVDSAIGGSGRADFSVSYSYTHASPSGGAERVRRTGESYSDGTSLTFEYKSTSNWLDDVAGRVTDVKLGSVVVASYDYVGAGQVVGTKLDEPGFYWHQYGGSTGSYSDLDRFDRVTKSKWTRSGKNFYDVDVSCDEDSNVTLVLDNIHKTAPVVSGGSVRTFDATYTMDNLNRLIRDEEGEWGGSSITTRKRDEQWTDGTDSQLDQIGNWGRYRLDLNGNGTFTDSGDQNDARAYTDRNELTTQDVDNDSVTDYTNSNDLNGNRINDQQYYKYVYNPFGQLRKVKDQSNNLVAEYRYNGRGYRIGWKYDSTRIGGGAPDGTVDSYDPMFWFCHDDRWRIVNTYRDTDTYPKERFVYHTAGTDGFGGSSYVDAVVLREDDDGTAWTDAADTTLPRRLDYMHNWRQDVSLIATCGAVLVEWVKYSAYGTPSEIPSFDSNCNFQNDVGENTHLLQVYAAGPSGYDARLDMDSDGDVDLTDYGLKPGYIGGRGVLSDSSIGNRKGYAGYEFDPVLLGAKYHVRHRVLADGQWLRADPLTYVDGMNAYAYVAGRPIVRDDPSGTYYLACSTQIDGLKPEAIKPPWPGTPIQNPVQLREPRRDELCPPCAYKGMSNLPGGPPPPANCNGACSFVLQLDVIQDDDGKPWSRLCFLHKGPGGFYGQGGEPTNAFDPNNACRSNQEGTHPDDDRIKYTLEDGTKCKIGPDDFKDHDWKYPIQRKECPFYTVPGSPSQKIGGGCIMMPGIVKDFDMVYTTELICKCEKDAASGMIDGLEQRWTLNEHY